MRVRDRIGPTYLRRVSGCRCGQPTPAPIRSEFDAEVGLAGSACRFPGQDGVDRRCGLVVGAGGFVGQSGRSPRSCSGAAMAEAVSSGVAGVVDSGRLDGASPGESFALVGRFGAEEVAHRGVWVVDCRDADLDFAGPFRACDELTCVDEVGVRVRTIRLAGLVGASALSSRADMFTWARSRAVSAARARSASRPAGPRPLRGPCGSAGSASPVRSSSFHAR